MNVQDCCLADWEVTAKRQIDLVCTRDLISESTYLHLRPNWLKLIMMQRPEWGAVSLTKSQIDQANGQQTLPGAAVAKCMRAY